MFLDSKQQHSGRCKINSINKLPKIDVKINGTLVNILVDTGACINVVDEKTFRKLKIKSKLGKPDAKIYAYGSKKDLPVLGKFQTTIESKDKIVTAEIHVIKGDHGCLLGYATCVDLQVVPKIELASVAESKHEVLCQKYSSIFEGIGKLKDTQIKLHIDESVQPVTQPHRRIPFHVRKQVEKEIEKTREIGHHRES